uniref:Cytoplasmic polyadenylated homeobox 1 n=1 Tax=Rattus norvegicus TaxID=10116 RepID=F1M859_RAT
MSSEFHFFPEKEVNHSRARAGCRRGKSKPRHKFTNDELKRLKQEFKCTPYPDFTTRDELARQFRCQVDVIDNWFQNKRARTPQELKDTFSAIRGMRKSGDYMLIGRQDTQTEEASREQYGSCDYVVQSIGTKSSGVVDTLPPVSESRYVGDQPETQESQYSTFSC